MSAVSENKQELTVSEKASDGRRFADGEPVGNSNDDTGEYVTGIKLAIIVASVALACFLMLLDTMVISTVSTLTIKIDLPSHLHRDTSTLLTGPSVSITRKGHSTHHRHLQFASRCGLVCQRISIWQVRTYLTLTKIISISTSSC